MRSGLFAALSGVTVGLWLLPTASGADGSWQTDATFVGGDWGTSANWASGIIADGTDSTAGFDNEFSVALHTVTLDSDRTIGNLSFSYIGGNGGRRALAGPHTLTLDRTSGMPTINIATPTTISAVLAGNDGITKTGNQALTLTAANTYTGTSTISGVLSAVDGVGLPASSNLNLTGDGYFSTVGEFNRVLGNGPGQVRWSGSGGFAARGGTMIVKVQNASNSNPNVLTWGSGGFVPISSALLLNTALSDSLLDFQNDIDLAGGVRTIIAPSNGGTTQISGVISNGALVRPNEGQLSGTLILTGNNTYGNTTLSNSGGTLRIGNGGTTGSLGTGLVTIANSVGLAFDRSNAMIVPNVISGEGFIAQRGSGTTRLTGNLSGFNGNTFVTSGTLILDYSTSDSSKIGNVLTIGSASLQLLGGVHLEAVMSTTISGAAAISRSSGGARLRLNAITFQAGGSLDISGDDVADTDTLNVDGVLRGVTVGGTLAKNSANGADGMIVALSNSDYVDVPHLGGQVVSGAGANVRLTNGGSGGSVVLAAAGTTTINTLTQSASAGATVVDIGGGNTLRLGNNGTVLIPSGAGGLTFVGGALTAGASDAIGDRLTFHNAADVMVSSTISNNGNRGIALTKIGSGRLTLTGPNSYSGDTAVGNGILQIGDGATSGSVGSGNIVNNATIVFNRSDAVTIGSMISGRGALVKTGAGSLTLTRNNIYGGGTTIQQGVLFANNNAGSTGLGGVIVESGATLGGTGTVSGSVVVNAGGRLAPGASIESLGVGGVALMPSAIAAFELDLGAQLKADLLDVTGVMNLGGATLNLSLLDALSPPVGPLTFLIATNDSTDAIVGTFVSVIGLPAIFDVTINYAFLGTDSLLRIGTGNDLAITITASAVPEPDAAPMICAIISGSLVVWPYRRRR